LDTNPYSQTKFFQSCRGVFEGGGCRGAAYVGAYAAAVKCGVNFAEVAGTSAGSIIAALIGAGADPDYLERTCAYLTFSTLLTKPRGEIQTSWLAKLVSYCFRGDYRILGRVLHDGSAYSSGKLQEWLDDRLAELLPHASRPIKFKDLPRPTWVVATDLAGRRPKVWSSVDTPDESVALAVRCSSSIPLFFEPPELGNDLYVDGGMLSNLPAFVFANRATNPKALGGRILAFRLAGDESYANERGIGWFVKRLIDTAISGSTVIQRSLQSNVSYLDIKTGSISSTNFDVSRDEVAFLLESGRATVCDFIRDENARLNDSLAVDIVRYGEDELYDDLVREMATPGQRVIVACTNTQWFWALFPSFVHWLFAGASVDILVSAGQTTPRERQRRTLLASMGARIVELPVVPITCFLLARTDDRNNAAFTLNKSDDKYAPFGAVYIGVSHRPVIAALLDMLSLMFDPRHAVPPSLTLRAGDPGRLADLLRRGVTQYGGAGIEIGMRQVSLTDRVKPVRTIVRRVRSFKYRQIQYLVNLYQRASIPLFAPADIYADNQFVSTLTPPVLEDTGAALVSVEGNTRICYLERSGISEFNALLVTGVTAPLPGIPVDSREILLSTYDLSSQERIAGFSYSNFRSIEGAVRPEA
jgi:predicted acylesterase/phospholipase RssA